MARYVTPFLQRADPAFWHLQPYAPSVDLEGNARSLGWPRGLFDRDWWTTGTIRIRIRRSSRMSGCDGRAAESGCSRLDGAREPLGSKTSRPRCWIEKIEGWRGLISEALTSTSSSPMLLSRRSPPYPPSLPHPSRSSHPPFSSTPSFLPSRSILLLPTSPSPPISVPTVLAASPYSFPRLRLLRPPRLRPLSPFALCATTPARPRTSSPAFFPHPASPPAPVLLLAPFALTPPTMSLHPLPVLVLYSSFPHTLPAPPFPVPRYAFHEPFPGHLGRRWAETGAGVRAHPSFPSHLSIPPFSVLPHRPRPPRPSPSLVVVPPSPSPASALASISSSPLLLFRSSRLHIWP
ncbi:hypothetical protein DFH09DRAFT_1325515 [Mycena vulgaris]|nr:hypothetical protein DFH09DRAFT_1325515 [Mycena vulgaris]